MGLNAALNMIDPESKQFFIRRTAREVIWGYDDTLSAFARYVIPCVSEIVAFTAENIDSKILISLAVGILPNIRQNQEN